MMKRFVGKGFFMCMCCLVYFFGRFRFLSAVLFMLSLYLEMCIYTILWFFSPLKKLA